MKTHLFLSILLLATFAGIFAHRNGWKDGQAPGDDPAYISTAYNIWTTGSYPDSLTWSPGYEVLMSPFVGMLGQEQGYKMWRFTLFAGITLLTYFAFSSAFGSVWIGLILGFLVQLFAVFYDSPSLQGLVALLYLVCLWLLARQARYLGFVFAILLNTILISGAVSPLLCSFAALCLILYPRIIFSRRFVGQVAVGVAIFALFLARYSYNVTRYPVQAAQRGRAGLYHQLSLYILKSGRSAAFLRPGEDSPERGVDDYHRHLPAIDRYYVTNWGQTENDLRAYSHDKRWPSFLLDWPWMFTKDPKLMQEYRHEVLITLKGSLRVAFGIAVPVLRGNNVTNMLVLTSEAVLLIFALVVSSAVFLVRRRTRWTLAIARPASLQILFLVCCLSMLGPLTLVMPLTIYFPPLVPAYLLACTLSAVALLKIMERLVPAREPVPVPVVAASRRVPRRPQSRKKARKVRR